jgi:hypothetical protein
MTLSVTINAHQLKLLIDKTVEHIGYEDLEPLHGIRLDVDSQYLYTVATDRFTIAAARYNLLHNDKNQEPWARLIPAGQLRTLREWIDTMKGAEYITVSTAKNRLVFDGPLADLTITVDPNLEFPDWRGLLRGIAAQTVDGEPFPALNSGFLNRWSTAGQSLRTRVTADRKAVLFFGEDFIGAQMPSNGGSIGPVKEQSFESAHSLWLWTLAAGGTDVDMASLPKPERSGYEAPKSVEETSEGLLRGVLRSTHDVTDTDYETDRALWHAHIRIAVANWMAFRYLDALQNVDPREAQDVAAHVAEQLDSGEIGEWAWDAAEEAGHKPQQWQDDYEKAVAEDNAKTAPAWAERLALSLNAARLADITFTVASNSHVAFDESTGQWTAVKPQPAETPA